MGSLAKEIRQLLEENDVCEESEELDIDEIVGWAMEDDDCEEMDEGCGSKHKSDDDDDDDEDDDEMDEDVHDDDLDEAFAYQAMKKKMAPSRDDELKRDSKAKKAERSKKIKALAKKSKLGPGKKMVFGRVVNVGEDINIEDVWGISEEKMKNMAGLSFEIIDMRGKKGFPEDDKGLVYAHRTNEPLKDKYTGIAKNWKRTFAIRTDASGRKGWRVDLMGSFGGPAEAIEGLRGYYKTPMAAAKKLAAYLKSVYQKGVYLESMDVDGGSEELQEMMAPNKKQLKGPKFRMKFNKTLLEMAKLIDDLEDMNRAVNWLGTDKENEDVWRKWAVIDRSTKKMVDLHERMSGFDIAAWQKMIP